MIDDAVWADVCGHITDLVALADQLQHPGLHGQIDERELGNISDVTIVGEWL